MNFVRARSILSLTAIAGASLLMVACPGSLTDDEKSALEGALGGEPGGGATCDAPTEVFEANCISCHDSSTNQGELNLEGDPFAALKDKKGWADGECAEHSLIDSQNPEASLLYTKVFKKTDPKFVGCGDPMPWSIGPNTKQANYAPCILSWIKSKLGTTGAGGGSAGTGGGAAGSNSGGSSNGGASSGGSSSGGANNGGAGTADSEGF